MTVGIGDNAVCAEERKRVGGVECSSAAVNGGASAVLGADRAVLPER